MHPVNLLVKPASGLCNMRCDYCFYCDEMSRRETPGYGIMSEAVLEQVLAKTLAFAEGGCTIAFQGGEPTLAGLPFFRRAVALAKQYNTRRVLLRFALQTNGYAMDEAWAAFFAEHGFLVGLSVDGPRKSHDAFRHGPDGAGSFYRAMDAAALLEGAGVDYNILTVVNRRTAAALRQMYVFYKKRGFHHLQFIPCLDPLGEEPGGQAYSLAPAAYGDFLCGLFDLWYADLQTGSQPYIRSFENYVGMLCGRPPESCDLRGICGAQYVVEADGGVYPCDFYVLDEYRLGSFADGDIAGFDAARERLGFVGDSMDLPAVCSACECFALCRGGCKRQRTAGHNRFCESYKQFFAHARPRLEAVAAGLLRDGPVRQRSDERSTGRWK